MSIGFILNLDPFSVTPTVDLSNSRPVFESGDKDCKISYKIYFDTNPCVNRLTCVSPDFFTECSQIIGDLPIGGCLV